MSDLYIKCVYCGGLYPFDSEKNDIHYEDSLRRCPVNCIDKYECFTCGKKGPDIFSNKELNKTCFKRCKICVEEGKIERFQKFKKIKKNKGELLIDAIKELDINLVKKLLDKGANPDYVIQDTLYYDETSMLPNIFEDIDEYRYTSLYNKLWDKNGKPIPSNLDEYNESPTTPLKIIVNMADENRYDNLVCLKLFNITQILILYGANCEDASEYWEYKFYDIDLRKMSIQDVHTLKLKPYLLIGLLIINS